jgi:Xaa-Pro aminopeptidase
MLIEQIQQALGENGLDGWLFFDHHRRDPLAYRILNIPDTVGATRRWYYFVPASGEPRKLVHRIESGALDNLPGIKATYASWTEQQERVKALLAGANRVAMQYSPNCAIPYVSLVDGGTLELIRNCGVTIVSSADLIQQFEAVWTEAQLDLHLEAGRIVDRVRRESFELISGQLRTGAAVNEFEVQRFILNRFDELGVETDHGPIVAVNAHASDPHYEPDCNRFSYIRPGDVVLIDLWAKKKSPDAVYYDITWTGFCGDPIPDEVQNVFEIVRDARKKASQFVIDKIAASRAIRGFEVDDVARGYIAGKGYGDYFFHRTGHSLGTSVHGTGANMDNLESHDERKIIPGTCFSVEPGIYLENFGIRSEVNVFAGAGYAKVTGEQQEQLIRI